MVKIRFYDPDANAPRRKKSKGAGFTLDWVQELGWSQNPFDKNLFRVAGMVDARKDINVFFVKQRQFGIISGAAGMGKSTLLRWLEGELVGHKLRVVRLNGQEHGGKDFRKHLASVFAGMFTAPTPTTDSSLVELLAKKGADTYIALVDDAEFLTNENLKTIEAVLSTEAKVVFTAASKITGLPAKDELKLTIDSLTTEDYVAILLDRIQHVGGQGTHPFSESVISRMAKDTDSLRDFLDLAQETAINVALKKATLGGHVTADDLAEGEEEKAETKKGLKKKTSIKKSQVQQKKEQKKRKYDELIESLSEDIE